MVDEFGALWEQWPKLRRQNYYDIWSLATPCDLDPKSYQPDEMANFLKSGLIKMSPKENAFLQLMLADAYCIGAFNPANYVARQFAAFLEKHPGSDFGAFCQVWVPTHTLQVSYSLCFELCFLIWMLSSISCKYSMSNVRRSKVQPNNIIHI
jgi:hypothetical protein